MSEGLGLSLLAARQLLSTLSLDCRLPTPSGYWPEWPVLAQDTGAGGTHGSWLREVGSHPLTPCGAVALSLSGKANGGGVFSSKHLPPPPFVSPGHLPTDSHLYYPAQRRLPPLIWVSREQTPGREQIWFWKADPLVAP